MVPDDTALSADVKNVQMLLDRTVKLMNILRPLVCPVPQEVLA